MPTPAVVGLTGCPHLQWGRYSQYSCELLARAPGDCTAPARCACLVAVVAFVANADSSFGWSSRVRSCGWYCSGLDGLFLHRAVLQLTAYCICSTWVHFYTCIFRTKCSRAVRDRATSRTHASARTRTRKCALASQSSASIYSRRLRGERVANIGTRGHRSANNSRTITSNSQTFLCNVL